MLTSDFLLPLSDAERQAYCEVVPEDHFLRRLLQAVDFEAFRPILEAAYKGFGRPPLDSVFLLKVELLARQYRLSDREVIAAIRFNIAHRLFLGIRLQSPLPHHTLLTYFRQRLGPERLQSAFDQLVAQARRLGLVKDRLRLKDATHIIANIAVPTTIRLVAEVRDQLLEALRPFAAERVEEETQRADAIRQATEEAKDEERLVQRVAHLRAVLAWADAVVGQAVFAQAGPRLQEKLRAALALAHKILADRDNPEAGDKVRSVHDPEARCGKHGDYYDGYLLDVAMDADSQLLTALNVLPANGDEGADAAHLIAQEEQAHGNDVQALSIDGAGYRGDVLRELTAADGLNLTVFTPPSARVPLPVFGPEQFTLSADGSTLTCPAGQTTSKRSDIGRDSGLRYRFSRQQCAGCSLRSQCLTNPEGSGRRTVFKNDYEAEYRAAQAQTQTPAYAQARKEHPAIERKLSELVNRHDLRHARYRGCAAVLVQGLLTGLVVNLKRMVRLLFAPVQAAAGWVRAAVTRVGSTSVHGSGAPAAGGTMRAALAMQG
jgi:IS5 family transposase